MASALKRGDSPPPPIPGFSQDIGGYKMTARSNASDPNKNTTRDKKEQRGGGTYKMGGFSCMCVSVFWGRGRARW